MKLGQLYLYVSIYGERCNSYILVLARERRYYVMYDLLCNIYFNTPIVGARWTLVD